MPANRKHLKFWPILPLVSIVIDERVPHLMFGPVCVGIGAKRSGETESVDCPGCSGTRGAHGAGRPSCACCRGLGVVEVV